MDSIQTEENGVDKCLENDEKLLFAFSITGSLIGTKFSELTLKNCAYAPHVLIDQMY